MRMMTQLLGGVCLLFTGFCGQLSICRAADDLPVPTSLNRIQIYDLISRMESAYQVGICTEDSVAGTHYEFDHVFVNPGEYDLSRLKLDQTLKKLAETHGITWHSSGRHVVIRSKSYNVKTSPLSRTVAPFKFEGPVIELLVYMMRGNDDVELQGHTNEHRDELRRVAVAYDTKTTIEDVLLEFAKRYGMTWSVTVDSQPMNWSTNEKPNATNAEAVLSVKKISAKTMVPGTSNELVLILPPRKVSHRVTFGFHRCNVLSQPPPRDPQPIFPK